MFAPLLLMGGGGQTGGESQGNPGLQMLVVFGGMILIFYFLLFRPQQKKQKEHQKMLEAVKKGDRVLTSGGLFGTIVGVKDDIAVLRIADDVKVEVTKASIQAVVKT
jgi:preprotein translocase subunit YajC